MFENPRRGKQARNFTTNVPKSLPNRYFLKIDVGSAPETFTNSYFSEFLFAVLFRGLEFSNKLLHLFKFCFPYLCSWHTVEMKPSSEI